MKQIRRTKKPSFKTMENMALNLRQHFRRFCTVEVASKVYSVGLKTEFMIYYEARPGTQCFYETYESWSDLQEAYFSLINKISV